MVVGWEEVLDFSGRFGLSGKVLLI